MSDLRLEDTVFQDLKKTFSSISDRMETTRRTLRSTDASAVGESKLVDEVQDFADDWTYGSSMPPSTDVFGRPEKKTAPKRASTT